MKFIKIISMDTFSPEEIKSKSGDGDGPSACLTGSCPTIYKTENGDFVVQGFVLNNEDKQNLKIATNEDAVLIPKELLDKFRG